MKKECYNPDCLNYTEELEVLKRNKQGEIIEKPPKTKDELEKLEFKNQVYDRLFKRIE